MKLYLDFNGDKRKVDLTRPIDLSRGILPGKGSSLAFFAPDIKIEPIQSGTFVGSVKEGSPINTNILSLNPHGNTTHTESVAHISDLDCPVNRIFIKPFLLCYLHTAEIISDGSDKYINRKAVDGLNLINAEALIIRTNVGTGPFSGSNPVAIKVAKVSKIFFCKSLGS